MADPAEMFEPLLDVEREAAQARPSASPKLDGWETVSPIPNDADEKIPPHRLPCRAIRP